VTVEFFEGPAGSGKTYNLIDRVRQVVGGNKLADSQRILALTFMNGARRRLESSLGKFPELRRRFECKTVDAFAQTIVARRRSFLGDCPADVAEASKLDEFDSKCFLAARLLQFASVARWVAASFPIVLVDEAQDLNAHRLPILQGLSSACAIVAAADEFQCLDSNVDSSAAISWLESHPNPVRLNGSQRTTQSGILEVAQAVRHGKNILPLLTKSGTRAIWRAPGFKLIETPGKFELAAWSISNELHGWLGKGNVAILTPHKDSPVVRKALEMVQSRAWTYTSGGTFGPFPLEWELDDKQRAADLCKQLELPELCAMQHVKCGEGALNDPALLRVRTRLERMARTSGEHEFSSATIMEMIGDAVRDVARFGGERRAMRAAMSIHRAKNREFKNVIVLWPMSASGSDDQKRRLLYNAITRAQQSCTIIVLGKDRLGAAPFGTEASASQDPNENSTRDPAKLRPRRRRKRTSGQ
jgi:hypothetical protein